MKAKEIERELTEEEYDEMLDDVYGEVNIAGFTYNTSDALKELDPTAYRCGKIDYESDLDRQWECSECGGVYEDEVEAEECCQEDVDN